MRRIPILLAMIAIVMTVVPATAFAQDSPGAGNGDSGAGYGFDDTCNDIHNDLDFGIPGLPSVGDAASAACKAGNAATHPGAAAGALADRAWDSTFGKVVDSLMRGLGEAINLSLTFWTKVPNEKITDSGTLFGRISDYTYEIQILLLIASVIITGARLAEARRGAAMSEAAESFRMFARVIFASWMLGAVVVAGTQVSDRFSAWLINDATGGNAHNIAELMVKTSKLQAFSPGLVLIIAIVGLLGSLAQIILAVVRQGMLVVAAGFLPMAAAASGMKIGNQSYQKLVGWIIAFILWKPVAAIVYMIAFTTAGDIDSNTPTGGMPDSGQAQRMLVGVVLLCSVAFVLPALMRLVAPVVAVAGTGGSGLSAAGATIVGAAALSIGGKSVGIRGAASPGRAGYVPPAGGPPPGSGGPGAPGAGGPPRPRPAPPGGGGGVGAPQPKHTGPSGSGHSSSRLDTARAAATAAATHISRAERFVGDAAGDHHDSGDRWGNRSPNLGRSTIPR